MMVLSAQLPVTPIITLTILQSQLHQYKPLTLWMPEPDQRFPPVLHPLTARPLFCIYHQRWYQVGNYPPVRYYQPCSLQ